MKKANKLKQYHNTFEIMKIPVEVFLYIMQLCTLNTLGSLACSNQYFYNLNKDDSLWEKLYKRDFPHHDNKSAETFREAYRKAVALDYSKLTARQKQIITATKYGDIYRVVEFSKEKNFLTDIQAKDSYGYTAMHYACGNAHLDLVKFLLKLTNSKKLLAATSNRIFTPMHLAANNDYKGCANIVWILINAGADANVQDKYYNTPLHWAAYRGHIETVATLLRLKSLKLDAKNESDITPLHMACHSGHLEIVELLLSAGADVNAKHTGRASTALHSAASLGNTKIINTLLQVDGIDVNARDEHLSTPLHCAVKYGHLEIVIALLKSGAKVNVEDDYGLTPLGIASDKGYQELMHLLTVRAAEANASRQVGLSQAQKSYGF